SGVALPGLETLGSGKELCAPLGYILAAESMCPFGIYFDGFRPGFGSSVCAPLGHGVCPFGARGVPLWDTGFCFFGVVEQRAVPAVEIAGRCNRRALRVIGGVLSQPPMSGDAIAIDAQTSTGGLNDKAVILKLTKPSLHRSCRLRSEIGCGVAVGSENLSVVETVHPQKPSQNGV